MRFILALAVAAAMMGSTPVRGQISEFPFLQSGDETEWQTFLDMMKKPNATSKTLSVIGYNITKKFPGPTMNQWKLSLSLVGDHRLNESTSATVLQMSYEPPEELDKSKTHDSYMNCAKFFLMSSENNRGSVVDPSCQDILTNECRDAALKMLKNSTNCEEKDLPRECEKELRRKGVLYSERFAGPEDFHEPAFGIRHEAGDLKQYGAYLTGIVVSMIGFSEYDAKKDDVVPNSEALPGILSCLQADQITPGSKTLRDVLRQVDEEKGTGIAFRPSVALAAMAAMVIASANVL